MVYFLLIMIRIALVEDEDSYTASFKDMLSRYENSRQIQVELTAFTDGAEIVGNYTDSFDIIFMDIKMKEMDGMTAAAKIRRMDASVVLIFITNLVQYAIKGYEVDALDYLVKPVSYFAFSQKLDRAVSRISLRNDAYISVQQENGLRKIMLSDIYYIESQGHSQIFHTAAGDIKIRDKMDDIEKRLEGQNFYRSNKGYLVNMKHVTGIEDGFCLIGGTRLIISRNRRKAFMDALTRYMGENLL
jgi:Response regulator of the LytR/AlgR family